MDKVQKTISSQPYCSMLLTDGGPHYNAEGPHLAHRSRARLQRHVQDTLHLAFSERIFMFRKSV